jgi:hypothetical protein
MRGLWADRSRLTLLTYALESIMFLDQIWCGDDGACPCQYVFLGTSDSNAVKLPLRHVGCEAIAAECLNFERRGDQCKQHVQGSAERTGCAMR